MQVGYLRNTQNTEQATTVDAALREAGCGTVFYDRGLGRRLPELSRALEQLRAGDVLVVHELAQLGLELPDVLQTVRLLAERRAHLRSLADGIDTTGAPETRQAILGVMAALAATLRRQQSERTRRGMKAAKKRGQHVGRPPKLTLAQIRRAQARVRCGEEVADLATSLGVSALTLRRHLRALREQDELRSEKLRLEEAL